MITGMLENFFEQTINNYYVYIFEAKEKKKRRKDAGAESEPKGTWDIAVCTVDNIQGRIIIVIVIHKARQNVNVKKTRAVSAHGAEAAEKKAMCD